MPVKPLVYISAALAILVLQGGFTNALPGPLAGLNPLLVAAVFLLAARGLAVCLYWALPLALALDLIAYAPFGLSALALAAALALADLLLRSYLTNRSLYSFLALTLAADALFRALAAAGQSLSARLDGRSAAFLWQGAYWADQAFYVLADLAAVALAFFILNIFSRQFRPVFVSRK